MRIASLAFSLCLVLTTACAEDDGTGGGSGGDSHGGDSMTTGGDNVPPQGDLTIPPGDTGPEVHGTITVAASCPTFSACGGALLGVWHYTEACFTEEELGLGDLDSVCASASFTINSTDLVGTLQFTATTVERNADATIDVTITLPKVACTIPNCGTAQTALNLAGLSATCSDTGTDCDCDMTFSEGIHDANSYAIVGNTVITGDGDTYEYCVNGTDIDFRDVTTSDPDPGLYSASR